MKPNWQTKKLGEVCVVGAGNSAPPKKEFFIDGIYPFFRTSDIGQIHIGRITESSDYLNEKGIKGLKLFNKGTILLPKSGASTFLNHRVLLGIDGYVSSHLATVKTDEKVLNSNYLFYFLQEVKAQDLIQDHKYPSLNLPIIGNVEITFPPLPEQRSIVKILDEVFADVAKAKENAEKNLQNAKELFESYLQSVFANPTSAKATAGKPRKDWEERELGDIGKVSMCKRIFKHQTTKAGDVPFYKIGTFGKEPDAFISNKIYKEFRNKFSFPKKGDVLISASGTIGRRVRYDGKPAYFQDSNIVWIDNDENQVLNDYLYSFYGTCNWNATKGATIPRLYNDNLKQIKISYPKSKTEQKEIVRKLDALFAETRKLETIYQQKLADLEELKKSVLKRAFNGDL